MSYIEVKSLKLIQRLGAGRFYVPVPDPRSVHDDVIKWKHFPCNWHFVRGIHRWPVNFPHKGQWRGALMFFFICSWINGWVNNTEAGDLRRHRAHHDVIVIGELYRIDNLAEYPDNIPSNGCRATFPTGAYARFVKQLNIKSSACWPAICQHFHTWLPAPWSYDCTVCILLTIASQLLVKCAQYSHWLIEISLSSYSVTNQ